MGRKIIVHINGDSVTFETKGYRGADCQKATRALERELGTVTSDTKTSEYYHQEKVNREEKQ